MANASEPVADIEDASVDYEVQIDRDRNAICLSFSFVDERDRARARVQLAFATDEAIALAARLLAAVDDLDARKVGEGG
jgi:hypothetical protein